MDEKRSFQSAKDVMTKKIVFVDGMATAKEAVEIMRKEKVEALIVKKRHEQDAYAIVNVHDCIKGVIIPDKTSEEVNVFEIMTKPAICVQANMDVRYVASLLMKVGFRMAPVEVEATSIVIPVDSILSSTLEPSSNLPDAKNSSSIIDSSPDIMS